MCHLRLLGGQNPKSLSRRRILRLFSGQDSRLMSGLTMPKRQKPTIRAHRGANGQPLKFVRSTDAKNPPVNLKSAHQTRRRFEENQMDSCPPNKRERQEVSLALIVS
jgi:hypothetical protein